MSWTCHLSSKLICVAPCIRFCQIYGLSSQAFVVQQVLRASWGGNHPGRYNLTFEARVLSCFIPRSPCTTPDSTVRMKTEAWWTRSCLTSMALLRISFLRAVRENPTKMPCRTALLSWALSWGLNILWFIHHVVCPNLFLNGSQKFKLTPRMSFPTVTANSSPTGVLPSWVDVLGWKID